MSLKNNKVLLVEDEFFLSEMLKSRLEYLGYSVRCAEDGAHAVETLKSDPVNVIIMDAVMPVMDGYEATLKIKADPKLKKIPIVFLTARAREQDRVKAYEAGADDYLTKPFEVDELVRKIKQWTE